MGLKKLLSVFFLSLACLTFVACGGNTEPKEFTVGFYYNDTKLFDQTVKEGELVKKPETNPTLEDKSYIFMGWFTTRSMEVEFPFATKEVNSNNVRVYAGFVKYTADENVYHVRGDGLGSLAGNGWEVKENAKLVKQEVIGKNVFTIELDLYVDDQFKIAANEAWDIQYGFDSLTGDVENNFIGEGDLGAKNIKVKNDGKYLFTLTTYPDNPKINTLVVERKGDVPEITKEIDGFYIFGDDVTGWLKPREDQYKFTGTGNTLTLTIELVEEKGFLFYRSFTLGSTQGEDIYVKFANIASSDAASLALVADNGDGNIKALAAGTYKFTLNVADLESIVLSVEKVS